MSEQTTDIFTFPACPHLNKGCCLAASNGLGCKNVVTAPVCQVTCKQTAGSPYAGRATQSPDLFLEKMLKFSHNGSVRKVKATYGAGCVVTYPTALIAAVKTAFVNVMKIPGVVGLGLSGSSIIAGTTPHDVDVVIVVADLRAWQIRTGTTPIPTSVNGLPIDLFVRQGFDSVFQTLDIFTSTLHTSSLYKVTSHDPKILAVIDAGHGRFAPASMYPSTAKVEQPVMLPVKAPRQPKIVKLPPNTQANLAGSTFRKTCRKCQRAKPR